MSLPSPSHAALPVIESIRKNAARSHPYGDNPQRRGPLASLLKSATMRANVMVDAEASTRATKGGG